MWGYRAGMVWVKRWDMGDSLEASMAVAVCSPPQATELELGGGPSSTGWPPVSKGNPWSLVPSGEG